MKLKLHQFLSRTGTAAKKEDIFGVISSARVRVGGKIVTAASYIFDPGKKRVYVDDVPVKMRRKLYLLVDKPAGVSCQKGEAPNIYDWLKENCKIEDSEARTLFTVGRLDKDTEGLIILTNDGKFSNAIAQPIEGIEKEYEVTVRGRLSTSGLEVLKKGPVIIVQGESYKTRPVLVKILKASGKETVINIIITEGKKRQIRLMAAALGHTITRLKRIRVGNLRLKDLGGKRVKVLDSLSAPAIV